MNQDSAIVIFYTIKNKNYEKDIYLTYNFNTQEKNIYHMSSLISGICKINENSIILQHSLNESMNIIYINQIYDIKIMTEAFDLNFLW